MESRRDVFQAIADPTRRQIIHMLAQKPLHVNAIAENFDMSRQAISLHIKVLSECGLIEIKQQGRARFCEPKLEKLEEVAAWIEPYKALWRDRFASLEEHLEKRKAKSKNKE
ncbi:MAG TPA: metalloregulator ArsR/SmtB family transcription factor [Cytophagales bacterium]|nr:metalloregulator ArsR/SmtB family transcription factor [Cytophagales bacterium]